MINFKIQDNSNKIIEEIEKKKPAILEAIGLTAEDHAKMACPTVTGRAKNSITHTASGRDAFTYKYKDDNGNKYEVDIPAVPESDSAVYIGSNVSYFPYLETGSSKRNPKHILRDAISNHLDDYKKIVADGLKDIKV